MACRSSFPGLLARARLLLPVLAVSLGAEQLHAQGDYSSRLLGSLEEKNVTLMLSAPTAEGDTLVLFVTCRADGEGSLNLGLRPAQLRHKELRDVAEGHVEGLMVSYELRLAAGTNRKFVSDWQAGLFYNDANEQFIVSSERFLNVPKTGELAEIIDIVTQPYFDVEMHLRELGPKKSIVFEMQERPYAGNDANFLDQLIFRDMCNE